LRCQKNIIFLIVFILTLFSKIDVSSNVEASISKNPEHHIITSYIKHRNKRISNSVASQIAHEIIMNSRNYNIRYSLLVGLIQVESNFMVRAKGVKGALGLMQVMPLWVKPFNLKNSHDLYNVRININSGTRILKRYMNQKNGNLDKALNRYVGGNPIYAQKVYKAESQFKNFQTKYKKKERSIAVNDIHNTAN
jgi:soluble lytic murein transglycosylase-like protein